MVNQEALLFLQEKLDKEVQEGYPKRSRVHALRSFGAGSYVKREDELGFGISGSKYRKYRTLIPYLRKYEEVIVLGGPFSNHVLGITQLLLENGIKPTLFLKGAPPEKDEGNFFFLQMLLPSSSLHWITNQEWPQIASEYAAAREKAFILPEGGALFPSFLGALTLPLDILRNEKERDLTFDQIFFDVGTGYSAAALLLGLAFLERRVHCHLLLVAGAEEEFRQSVKELHSQFKRWLGKRCPWPEAFTCHLPTLARSFGSTNKTLFQFIFQTAQEEGFFLDPIYSGKLFYHAKGLLKEKKMEGNSLLIHSGGALSLSGFQ